MASESQSVNMQSVACVLFGVAEVKLPLRRLDKNIQLRIANMSHKAVLDPDPPEGKPSAELEEQRQFIGVVDGYYALSEVEVKLDNGLCEVKKSQESVVRHKARDVIIITPVKDFPMRVVYISRNENFGRAAVVLQMKSNTDVEKLLSFFPEAVPECHGPAIPSNELQLQSHKEAKASLGKVMGKRFTSMFASLTTTSPPKRSILKPSDRLDRAPDSAESPSLTRKKSIHSSSESEDDMETNTEDTDSQSGGKYYEEMGLDSQVQERLYDDSVETASISSGSYMESNAYKIESEIRFFVESHGDFLKTIQSLEEDREHLAGPDTPQFIRENLTLLFLQVKSVTRLHTELHDEFQRSGYSIIQICEAIIRHQIDYTSYVYFLENIPTVDKIIQNHVDYFKANMPDLPEKLRKPRMRLHYFVLTLETLQKKCSSSNEKRILNNAMEVLKIPLKRADSNLFLGAVTGSPFNVSDLGNVIRHSDLRLHRGGDLTRRVYHVLVLRTMLILTISKDRNYQYITSFRMDQVGLGKEERGVMFSLHVRNGPRGSSVVYVFKARKINIQQQWISVLREILAKKSQSVTPGNSIMDGKSELRRSKVRREQSLDKPQKLGQTSDSQDIERECKGVGRSVSEGSNFGARRTHAIKKSNSSASGRYRPLTRLQSANIPVTIRDSVNWKNSERLPPLKIDSIFPQLEKIFNNDQSDDKSWDTQIPIMKNHELIYTSVLNDNLGSFLSDEFLKPPHCIVQHMRRLYEFHSSCFSPMLERACHTLVPEEIAKCFTENAVEFCEIYTNYLADRARYDAQMSKIINLNNSYMYPIRHFEMYVETLRKLQKHTNNRSCTVVEEAVDVLRRCITNANTILLTESVSGAPFDLDECGPILHEGTIRVRRAGILIRQEMYVVLLNTLILFLEPCIPSYKYVDVLRMDTVGMGPSQDPLSFQLEVRTEATKTLTYNFKAQDKISKMEWEQEITKILSKQVELLKERVKRRLANEEVNMKHIENLEDLHSIDRPNDIRPKNWPLETSL